jgi:hypothetical protein
MAWRIKLITIFCTQMEKLKTNTNLSEAILNCIDSAIAARTIRTQGPCHEALKAQHRLAGLVWCVAIGQRNGKGHMNDHIMKSPLKKHGNKGTNESSKWHAGKRNYYKLHGDN